MFLQSPEVLWSPDSKFWESCCTASGAVTPAAEGMLPGCGGTVAACRKICCKVQEWFVPVWMILSKSRFQNKGYRGPKQSISGYPLFSRHTDPCTADLAYCIHLSLRSCHSFCSSSHWRAILGSGAKFFLKTSKAYIHCVNLKQDMQGFGFMERS